MVEDAACLLAPGRWTQLLARGRHGRLDRAIAAGADPARSALLAARAAQLAGRAMRMRVAADLERAARTADLTGYRFRTPPVAEAVRHNRDEMLSLAHTLREPRPAYARGVALLELLISDGAGPVYTDPSGESLARRLRQARARLDG